jgi:maleylpyruvate isomerase
MTFDALTLPQRLAIARQGTARLARHVHGLTDAQLDQPSLLPDWTRRHLIAHIGYNAAALCRLLVWADTGVRTPMYESTQQRDREITDGASLSGPALRNLFDHTAARLDRSWRHLPGRAWSAQVRTARGRDVPASESIWMRTREVWIHAVDLDNGAQFDDFPEEILHSLLTDIVGTWRARGLGNGITLQPHGQPPIPVLDGGSEPHLINGSLPDVVRWATGRGSQFSPPPPHWL